MAMNRQRRTSNLNNILTYDTLGNSTLIANLTVEGLTGAGFVKADAAGLLSVDTAAYTVTTGATNYLTKITAANTLGQSLVYDNGTSVLVNSITGVPGYTHAFQVVANAAGGLVVSTTDIASAIGIVNSSSANKTWDISPYGNHLVINESGVATRMKFDAGGNITIGDITNSGHKLEIVGSFRTTGTNTLSELQGVGDRMVVANTNGVLSTQAIPTGSITGSGAAGQINFWTGANTVSGSNNLSWDNANSRLGVGTIAPGYMLDLTENLAAPAQIGIRTANGLVNMVNGTMIANIEFSGWKGGGFGNENAAIQVYYNGNGTNRRGKMHLLVAESTNLGGSNITLSQSTNNNKITIVGTGGNAYDDTIVSPSLSTTYAQHANTIISGDGGIPILSIDRAGIVQSVVFSDGNWGIGTTTNATYKFDVNGTSRFQNNMIIVGGGADSTTTALTVQNSSSTDILRVRNDGAVLLGAALTYTNVGSRAIFTTADEMRFSRTAAATDTTGSKDFFQMLTSFSPTSGTAQYNFFNINTTVNQIGGANGVTRGLLVNPNLTAAADFRGVEVTATFNPTSGTGVFNGFVYNATINQTGGANGITRGIWINPTLTAAFDFRAIEVGAGKVVFGGTLEVTGASTFSSNMTVNGVSVGRGAANVATNTALGASALIANTSGLQNTAVGNEALRLTTTGSQNSALGYRASRGNTTGSTNSAFGIDALRLNTTGNNNVAFGARTLDNNTVGNNTAIGTESLVDNTTGASNTSLGYQAGAVGLNSNTTGSNNIFIGASSVGELNSDSNRTFIGNTSTTSTWLGGRLLLGARTDDATNRLQVTGNSALVGVAYVNTNANIASYGHSLQVLANASGGMIVSTTNTASGIGIVNSSSTNKTWDISPFNNDLAINESGVANGTRMYFSAGGNVLIGSISDNATNKLQVTGSISATVDSVINGVTIGKGGGGGALNTAVGSLALSANTTGASNTAFGLGALGTITTGSENVAVGTNAGRYRNGTTSNSDSSGGVYIGFASRASAAATTNEIVIGSGAQGSGDNTVTIGNTGITTTVLRGNVSSNGFIRSNASKTAAINEVSIALNGNNITTYPASFTMSAGGYGLNAIYAQHEQRFGGDASFDSSNIIGGGLSINKLAPTAAGTITIGQASGRIRTMSNFHLMTQFDGNNNLTVTHMSGLHIYGHYRTSGSGTITVSTAYYGVLLADPNEFGGGATVTGSNYGFYQQGAAPYNYFGGKVSIGTTETDGTSKLRISGLPTSSAGLLAGEVWSNGGVLTIV